MPDIKLKPQQRLAAAMLATGKGRVEVAKELGVNPQTITRWKRENPEFNNEIDAILHKELAELAPLAVAVLREQLSDPNQWLRQNAAREILNRNAIENKQTEKEVVIRLEGAPELGMPPLDDTPE